MGWFEDNGIYEAGGIAGDRERVYSPGYRAPDDAVVPPEATPPPAPAFNLQGAQVHGRDAVLTDPNDLLWLAMRQPGYDVSSNEASRRTYENIIQPLFQQQGLNPSLINHEKTDKIQVNGRTFDYVRGAGGANPEATVYEEGRGGGAPAGGGVSLAQYAAPINGGGIPVGTPGRLSGRFAPYEYEAFQAPEPFVAPTLADAQADPGYQFGAQEAQQAVERSAALKGKLRTGGTLKDVGRYLSDYATTRYGDVYGRRASEYDRTFANRFGVNQANNQGRLAGFTANTNADLGYGNLDLGYTNAGIQRELGLGNIGLGYYRANIDRDLGQGQLGLGWANYGLNADEQQFSQGYRLSDMGLRAADILGRYGSSYGANAADAITGGANANAAGRVGAANAVTGAINNGANIALGGYYASTYGSQPRRGGYADNPYLRDY